MGVRTRASYFRIVAIIAAHCYGCGTTVGVRADHMAEDIARAGWTDQAGQTYCASCATQRGLKPPASGYSDQSPRDLTAERALVQWLERWFQALVGVGVLTTIAGLLVLLRFNGGYPGRGVAVLAIGLGIVLSAWSWQPTISGAWEALKLPPLDLRLYVEVRGTWTYSPVTSGHILPASGDTRPLATFSWRFWSRPRFVQVPIRPALVYGIPVKGAAVVVSCDGAVFVGDLKWSRYDHEPPTPLILRTRAGVRVAKFMFKPRQIGRKG